MELHTQIPANNISQLNQLSQNSSKYSGSWSTTLCISEKVQTGGVGGRSSVSIWFSEAVITPVRSSIGSSSTVPVAISVCGGGDCSPVFVIGAGGVSLSPSEFVGVSISFGVSVVEPVVGSNGGVSGNSNGVSIGMSIDDSPVKRESSKPGSSKDHSPDNDCGSSIWSDCCLENNISHGFAKTQSII